jgi:predicted transcriptional regulator
MSLEIPSGGESGDATLIELTTRIVSAYLANNTVKADDLPVLIQNVHESLSGINPDGAKGVPETPAVPVQQSITEDHLICLEDGEKFKSLRRHLRSKYDMSPEEYREKWGLPYDYPMVAPSYARRRSMLAKQMGLGQSKKT